MKVHEISKRKFDTLTPLDLPREVFNTEAMMYLCPVKNRWAEETKIAKRFYNDTGAVFGNKMYTVYSLLEHKDSIHMDSLVMPEKVLSVSHEICGFTMPYIPNYNLESIMRSNEISISKKIEYLKQIGYLLEKIKRARKYSSCSDIYLNDIHESNFIIGKEDDKVYAVDMDSVKIGTNAVMPSRYLSPFSQLQYCGKYEQLTSSLGGCYNPDDNTEIYCYIIMIFKLIYGENIARLSIADFYVYLDYLAKLGVSYELLDKFACIYLNKDNENPYELLDELVSVYPRSTHHVFDLVRKKQVVYGR